MTTLGSPIPVRFRVFWLAEKGQKKPPNPFRGFLAEKGPKNPKWTGMTSLGSPGLSSQTVLGFSGRKKTKNAETEWDDKLGKPRFVIPVRFGVFWPKRAKIPETDGHDKPGKPRLVSPHPNPDFQKHPDFLKSFQKYRQGSRKIKVLFDFARKLKITKFR